MSRCQVRAPPLADQDDTVLDVGDETENNVEPNDSGSDIHRPVQHWRARIVMLSSHSRASNEIDINEHTASPIRRLGPLTSQAATPKATQPTQKPDKSRALDRPSLLRLPSQTAIPPLSNPLGSAGRKLSETSAS
jgi:hypothetical protein